MPTVCYNIRLYFD